MRKPIVAGNWKMHKTVAESVEFVNALKDKLAPYDSVEQVVVPTYLALVPVSEALKGSPIKVGAQDVHQEAKGAYTSSIAANMLTDIVEYVIIGHSETRQYLGVTDELVNQRVKAALAHNLKPIIALGENYEQRQAGEADSVVRRQVEAAFAGIDKSALENIVVAYEPIWAIGTGMNAEADMVNDLLGTTIRGTLENLYDAEAADAMRIQYGGSVKPNNMVEYMQQPNIDGALVGGASLDVDSFTDLIRLTVEAKS
jgi:triosephosphate isomerase